MRRLRMLAFLTAGVLAAAAPAGAQGFFPLALEVRGGAAFPTGDLKDSFDAETGTSYGINATLQATGLLGIYAGYERAELGVGGGSLAEGDITDQGFAFGGKLTLPFGGLIGLGPWIRAGAVYNDLTLDGEGNAVDIESDSGFGFEVGGGLSIPLGMVVSVTPGVRYRSYSPGGESATFEDFDASYFVADLGLSFSF